MDSIERISAGGELLAVLIRGGWKPGKTEFLTSPESPQQLGMIVYPEGGEIQRHVHRPVERKVRGTTEVIQVRSGRCLLELYGADGGLAASRELSTGDIVFLVAGGHGFRMLEDTVLFEVKQGPYAGGQDKERF
jgi:hypothetical protein